MNFVTPLYEAIPINFYIHYTLGSVAVSSSPCLFLLSSHSFSFVFSSFYLNRQLFLAQHNGHYLCFNDLNWRSEQKRKTFNRPSSRLLVDSVVVYYWPVCAVLSCSYVLLIHFAQIIDIPRRHRCPCADLLTSPQFSRSNNCPGPRDRASVASRARPKKERKKNRMCIERSIFYIQIM